MVGHAELIVCNQKTNLVGRPGQPNTIKKGRSESVGFTAPIKISRTIPPQIEFYLARNHALKEPSKNHFQIYP